MPRIFQQVVFKEVVDGTTPVYSASEFNESLARADQLSVYIRASGSSGTSPTLSVRLLGSNDGLNWFEQVDFHESPVGISTLYENNFDTTEAVLAAFLRFEVTLGGTNPAATVSIAVCGRTE